MGAHSVTLIPGDGIGPEVTAAAVAVVAATGVDIEWDVHDVGLPAMESAARQPLPDAVLASIRERRFALKGPVSTPRRSAGFRSVNVELRRSLGLFAQARRCRSWPGAPAPCGPMDVVVIRETTEDLYAGVEAARGSPLAKEIIGALSAAGQSVKPDAGLSIKWVTPEASRRAVEFAFRHARAHDRRRVTVAHKATVMRETDALFLGAAAAVAEEHGDIGFDDCLVDDLCARLVRDPGAFDVLVMLNQYGDLVSDLCAALAGGVGLVPGVNVGERIMLFEPGHGSAPSHAGRNEANPTATILSAALLLRALGEEAAADAVEQAVGRVLARGRSVTYDLVAPGRGVSPASTSAMAEAVARELSP